MQERFIKRVALCSARFSLLYTIWKVCKIYHYIIYIHSHYAKDLPAPVQNEVMEAYDINTSEYNLFYSCYALPNIFLVLLSGFFIDKVGQRISMNVFNSLLLIGQILFVISAIPGHENYWLALCARFIFG